MFRTHKPFHSLILIIFFIALHIGVAAQAHRYHLGAKSSEQDTQDQTVSSRPIRQIGYGRNRDLAVMANRIGSRPPSCLNKCDHCTPCQAVQHGQSLAEMSIEIGSRPPSCRNKCNSCNPCRAVQVPTPLDKPTRPIDEPAVRHSHATAAAARKHQPSTDPSDISIQYSNYKPEGWKCKCGNKLFNP